MSGRWVRVSFLILLACVSPGALAGFDIDSLYSNADGTIQYVMLHENGGGNGLHLLRGGQLTATHGNTTKTYTFTHDLPSAATANRYVLLATHALAAKSLIVPDYVLPTRFLPVDGSTVKFSNFGDGAVPFPGAQTDVVSYPILPTDGDRAWQRGGTFAFGLAHNFAGETTAPGQRGSPITVVEYVNPALDHYFMSPLAPDIDALDSGRIAGWVRTGQTWRLYPAGTAGLTNPVCRFYIPPQHGNSHFFSAYPPECADVERKTATDPNYSGFVYESPEAFDALLPNLSSGACPANTTPVYRLWNQRADSNHRYTIESAIRAQMVARNYVPEGFGAQGVGMCAIVIAVDATPIAVTANTPFAPDCDGVAATGLLFAGAEVEPMVAIDPRDPKRVIGTWQQDRWSNGGARGLAAGVSRDGGTTWSRRPLPFSRCGGGNAQNGGDFSRATDPWVTVTPDSRAFAISISFNGAGFAAGSSNAVLVSRSPDGGTSWENPVTLINDGAQFFNDKESITADPTDARFVYAAWDRLDTGNRGPAYFSRTTNGGATWEPAHEIYDPGVGLQTINNQVVVLPDGTLLYFHSHLDNQANAAMPVRLALLRSTDKGVNWSAPITIATVQALGASDPQTGTPIRDGALLGAIAVGPNGKIVVAWQDARFSGGVRDGIAFAQSLDGGQTWSTPRRINGDPSVQAFTPTIHIRDDGTIGVTYYDLRSNTADPQTLFADYWLVQSNDGVNWRETHVAGPFNLALAPNAGGLFLGDYQALTSIEDAFVPFFVMTTPQATNRNDVYAARITGAGNVGAAAAAEKSGTARIASRVIMTMTSEPLPMTPEFTQQLQGSVARVIARRLARGH